MKIAAICAYPAGLNAGMLSVDFSLDHMLHKIDPKIQLTKFNIERQVNIGTVDRPLNYEHLVNTSQLEQFDYILFWGDFLHWIDYANLDLVYRKKLKDEKIAKEAVIEQWFELLLLEGKPDLQKKVLVFGTSLYGLNATQLSNQRYAKAITSLYANAKHVQMREIYSVNYLSQLIPSVNARYGCDCSLFLDINQMGIDEPIVDAEPYIAYSLGRSGANSAILALLNVIAAISKKRLVNINWLDNSGVDGFRKKLSLLKGADYVITDIYHMSINALREQKPTLCIGKGSDNVLTTLSDAKKQLFFTQAFAANYYIFLEKILDCLASDRKIQHLALHCIGLLNDRAANDFIFTMLGNQVSRSLSHMAKALD